MAGVRAWGAVTALCWVVSLVLVVLPVRSGGGYQCVGPIEVLAAVPDTSQCLDRAQVRLRALAVALVVTGAVSTAFVARCALTGRRTAG